MFTHTDNLLLQVIARRQRLGRQARRETLSLPPQGSALEDLLAGARTVRALFSTHKRQP